MEKAAASGRARSPGPVRCFIRILLCTLQHTIAAVSAHGQSPGGRIRDCWGGKSETESPNHRKPAGPGAPRRLRCSDADSRPRAQTLLLTGNKRSARPPTEPCKAGLINRFLAASEPPILHADARLYL